MRTVRLELTYDGSLFAGWQRQAGFRSVQQCLEEAVARLTGEATTVHGSGRTDAGVHALRQVAHFRTGSVLPRERILPGLNSWLPEGITVRSVVDAPEGFHARFSATGKRYVYRMVVSRLRPALLRDQRAWIPYRVDVGPMREAARLLLGEHDFAAFTTAEAGRRHPSTVRRIERLHLRRRGEQLDLFVQGNGFLHFMVRNLAGSLLEVGRGKQRPEWIAEVLASRDRRRSGPTAPAHGLFLLRVLYR
jgi:tRNA pseudouridine38-40 synthase